MDIEETSVSVFLPFDEDTFHRCMNPIPCFFFAACHGYSAYFARGARKTFSASFENKISISVSRLDVPGVTKKIYIKKRGSGVDQNLTF
jgi:hypothetical protein